MERKDLLDTIIPTTLITAVGLIAAALASGLQLHAGHDAAEYIIMLEFLADGAWTAPSYVWPPGFPLLGLPFVWLGLPADMALFTVQLLSFSTVVVLVWFIMRNSGGRLWLRTLLLLAFALAPVVHSVMYDFRSELPFAAVMVILAWVPLPWNNSSRGIAAGLLVTVLFLIRYVGIAFVALPALAWFIIRPRQSGTGAPAVIAMLSACLLILLYIAAVAEAPVTGYAIADFNANLDVLTHASDFGLSMLGVIGRYAQGYLHGPIRVVAGLLFLGFLMGALVAGIRSRNQQTALLALAAAVYIVGIIGMRCLFWFDPLYAPRFALPVLPALVVSLGGIAVKHRYIIYGLLAAAAAVIIIQLVQLFR